MASADVLLVEDNADTRDALRLFLELRGYAVASAKDGAEALALLRDGLRPCVILLDWNMPRLDGAGFRAAQLEMRDAATVSVAVITASALGCAEARRIGLADCFVKPLDPEHIAHFVDEKCAARERAGNTTR